MSLQCGIIGLPNVGKSTLFNALSKAQVASANFPFCTIEPNVGRVSVPDTRLMQLASLVNPQKTLPTSIQIVDIAGLVKGASKGEGLGNQFLAHIRQVDVLLHMIRCFDNPDVLHVAGGVDPVFDKDIIDQELQVKDLITLKKRLHKIEKITKAGDKQALQEQTLAKEYIAALEKGQNARSLKISSEHHPILQNWHLLTSKPVIYVANVDEDTLKKGTNPHLSKLQQAIKNQHAPLISICADLEAQIAALPTEEQSDFFNTYNLSKTGLDQLIQTTYQLLGLITYFTAGPEEVRAWTIPKNTLAPQAAGVIHTDFEKQFIKAQVIKLPDYLYYKTEQACKQAGKISIQGKSYLVQDGDIIHFVCNT